jgi:NTP pyrophosphatase (non-canonical NTP hydrolase)
MRHSKKFESIRQWAQEREIYAQGDSKTQFLKLQEEAGELAQAILKRDDHEFYDAIGDCVVVLTNIVELYEREKFIRDGDLRYKLMKIEDCISLAFENISKRTGKMENGTFVKDE